MAKRKRQQFELKMNKSVSSYVWAVLLVVTIPALYVLFFVAKARTDLRANSNRSSTVQGYASKEMCMQEMGTNCYQVTTIQEDQYWIPQQ